MNNIFQFVIPYQKNSHSHSNSLKNTSQKEELKIHKPLYLYVSHNVHKPGKVLSGKDTETINTENKEYSLQDLYFFLMF
jgi:hypothetical protein